MFKSPQANALSEKGQKKLAHIVDQYVRRRTCVDSIFEVV